MDFTNQNNRQAPQRPSTLGSNPVSEQQPESNKKEGNKVRKHIDKLTATKIPFLLLSACITILLLALVFKIFIFAGDTESKAVNKSAYQAVFLNNNQVYFGKITDFNKSALNLEDIYYIQLDNNGQQSTQQANSNNITLVKLGCEIHGPQDKMVINRTQIIFWENLKDDGQVVKTIKADKEKGPQNCNAQNSGSGSTNQRPSSTTGGQNTTTQSGNSTGTQSSPSTQTPATTPTPATPANP